MGTFSCRDEDDHKGSEERVTAKSIQKEYTEKEGQPSED